MEYFLFAVVYWVVALLAYASGKQTGRREERSDILSKGWDHDM